MLSASKLPLKSGAPEDDAALAMALAMPTPFADEDDDDFQSPNRIVSLNQKLLLSSCKEPTKNPKKKPNPEPLKPSNGAHSSKKPKCTARKGKENSRKALGSDLGLKLQVPDSPVSGFNTSTVNSSSGPGSGNQGCKIETRHGSMLIEARLNREVAVCSRIETGTLESSEFQKTPGLDPSLQMQSPVSPVPGSEILTLNSSFGSGCEDQGGKIGNGYSSMSIEARLLESKVKQRVPVSPRIETCRLGSEGNCSVDFEPGSQLTTLVSLCFRPEADQKGDGATVANGVVLGDRNGGDMGDFENLEIGSERMEGEVVGGEVNWAGLDATVECPLCGMDISDLSEELRQVHTNSCLDKDELQKVIIPNDSVKEKSPEQVVGIAPVLKWLQNLGLSRYEDAFIRDEIDWETLQWLREEDLLSLGVTALGPRKKIVHALNELKRKSMHADEVPLDVAKTTANEIKTFGSENKLITEYFRGSFVTERNQNAGTSKSHQGLERGNAASGHKRVRMRNQVRVGNLSDVPPWCTVPGTPFRVDAFRYLRGDCSHWFLTHFHTDHYQGLTRGFCHGKIYCSSITARLVNMKIGVPFDQLQVLPLNQKININGVNVTCLDANHCPGSIIILFKPPNGKAVLHTGDFRFCEEMLSDPTLESCHIHTLILDTTYCNPQYDFPRQEAVIQFVIEAIQAEAFNPRTLFLIGSYTIGKERLFLEVARVLHKKVYVGTAKLKLMECLGIPKEDMKWFTSNELESQIHVVPMWTIASFKRMKHISNRYSDRYNLIVAFSPTGWTFGKGKKKSPGRRSQQGTIIRYEVPYSEHCSFTELRKFVLFLSPENIIPSVNNDGPESADAMVALLSPDS